MKEEFPHCSTDRNAARDFPAGISPLASALRQREVPALRGHTRCYAPAFQERKNGASILSLEAAVQEHREAKQSLIHLLLTGAASPHSPLGVSSCSAQCRRGQGMKAPVEP